MILLASRMYISNSRYFCKEYCLMYITGLTTVITRHLLTAAYSLKTLMCPCLVVSTMCLSRVKLNLELENRETLPFPSKSVLKIWINNQFISKPNPAVLHIYMHDLCVHQNIFVIMILRLLRITSGTFWQIIFHKLLTITSSFSCCIFSEKKGYFKKCAGEKYTT